MNPTTRTNVRKKRTILTVDQLEDRTLPAGNVAAYVSGGILFVTTTAPGASVSINSTSDSSATIMPLASGTTIDGRSGAVSLDGIAFAYDVALEGKGDFLEVTGATGNLGVYVSMLGGNGGLALMNSHDGGTTMLDMGAGNNVVAMGGDNLTGPTKINLGGGNNRIYFSTSQFGDLAIVGGSGAGPNSIGIQNVVFHSTPSVTGFQYVFGSLMPSANNDSATVNSGGSVTINVAANDAATEGTLNLNSIEITSQPAHGTVKVNGNGTVTYTSDSGTTALSDSFKYVIKNSGGAISNEATVSLTIAGAPKLTPTITSTATSPTNLTPIPIKVVFNEDVTGFASTDVNVTNGTVSNFVKVNAKTYTFDVAPTADGTVTVNVPAGAAQDSSGEQSTAATFSITSRRTAPTATISSTATSPTKLASIPVTVTFGESVTGFSLSKVTVTNGTASGLAGSGAVYTFNVTPTADGTVTVNVAAGAGTDAAGNASTAATPFSITSDQTAPTVAINPTSTQVISGTSSDATSGVSGVVLSIFNGSAYWNGTAFSGTTETFNTATSANNFATWSFPFTTAGTYTVHARATDKAGNVGNATTSVTVS